MMLKNIILLVTAVLVMSGCGTKTLLSKGGNSVMLGSSSGSNNSNTILSSSGSYSGDMQNGLPHGYGSYTWNSGERYKGSYADGVKSGEGTFTWSDGTTYSGSFSRGKRFGQGKQEQKNSYTLKGLFQNNECKNCDYKSRNLLGVKSVDGDFILSDSYVAPTNVTIVYNDNNVYNGEVNSKYLPHGNGSKTLEGGNQILVAIWNNGVVEKAITKNYTKSYVQKMKSKQKCEMADKSWIYIGSDCSDNLASGSGKAIAISGTETFKGNFKKGEFTKGTHSFSNSKIKGTWENGQLNGKASYTVNNELIYEGQYVDGLKQGKGMCSYQNEFESCEYFHDKRIDALYKMRKEQEKIAALKQAEMAKQQQPVVARNIVTMQTQSKAVVNKPTSFTSWLGSCASSVVALKACSKGSSFIPLLGGFANKICRSKVIEGSECMKDVPAAWIAQIR